MSVAKIVVIGSLNMDLIIQAPYFPAPGETVIGGMFHTAAGGKGANQAVAAARLGGRVFMVGRVGMDAYGEDLLTGLAHDGVDISWVTRDESAHTGIALIVVDDRGQNSIVVSSGANWRLSPSDVDRAVQVIRDADLVVMQLEIPLETVTHAVALAARYQVPVLLNPAPARALSEEVLCNLQYLVLNENEAQLLTGISVGDVKSARDAARILRDLGVPVVVVTLGERGAYVLASHVDTHVPAFSVHAVDTTAAGDAFVGAFAVAIAQNMPLEEAVRFGAAAGALAATKIGAQPSLPTLPDVERLLKSAL